MLNSDLSEQPIPLIISALYKNKKTTHCEYIDYFYCSQPEGLRRITYSNAVHTKEAIAVESKANSLQLWCHAKAAETDPVSSYIEASLFCKYPILPIVTGNFNDHICRVSLLEKN